jgi:hypothetical protein
MSQGPERADHLGRVLDAGPQDRPFDSHERLRK